MKFGVKIANNELGDMVRDNTKVASSTRPMSRYEASDDGYQQGQREQMVVQNMLTMSHKMISTYPRSISLGQTDGEGFFQKLGLKRNTSE